MRKRHKVPPYGSKREKLYKPMSKVAPINTVTLAYSDYLKMKTEHLLRVDKNKVTAARAIALEQVKKAVKGDLSSTKEVTDRTEGKPVQPTDLTTGGEKIEFVIKRGA